MRFESPEQSAIRNQSYLFSDVEVSKLKLLLKKFITDSPNVGDFSNIYSLQEIANDVSEVDRLKAAYEKNDTEKEHILSLTEFKYIIADMSKLWYDLTREGPSWTYPLNLLNT